MKTASSLIERARSLADLVNSKFISYDDEVSSLNESYRDIYSWLCNNDDDYFVKEFLTTVVANVPNDPTVAIVALPEDFYKLRFIDYQYQGYWTRVRKYSTEARDNNPASPQYRFYGKDLRIIGINPNGSNGSLRLTYYPPVDVITLPEYAYDYGSSIAAYNKNLVNAPIYTSEGNSLIYVYNGTSIRLESVDNSTVSSPVTLYTSTGLSRVQYYKGYIYFLQNGEIYRFPSDLTTAYTTPPPTYITDGTSSVVDYTVTNNEIVFTTATETYECELDGSNPVAAATHSGTFSCFIAGQLCYINGTSDLVVADVPLVADVTSVTSDASYIYYVNAANELHKVTLTDAFAIDTDELLREDVSFVGSYSAFRLPIITFENDSLVAISTIPDWEFAYPLNEVNEIISYQAAIDFKRKQNADYSQLQTRMSELQSRFLDVMKRDEGLPQKIGNAYSTYDSQWR